MRMVLYYALIWVPLIIVAVGWWVNNRRPAFKVMRGRDLDRAATTWGLVRKRWEWDSQFRRRITRHLRLGITQAVQSSCFVGMRNDENMRSRIQSEITKVLDRGKSPNP